MSAQRLALDPSRFNDDVRQQLVPYVASTDDASRPDALAEYQRSLIAPAHDLMYRAVARAANPEVFSKGLPFLALAATLIGIAASARRLAGPAAAALALALALQTPTFMARMAGGHPRAFAFPVLATGLWCLISGRVRWLCALAVLAAWFYPPAAAVLGILVAACLLVLPAPDRGDVASWSRLTRITVLLAVGLLMAVPAVMVDRASARWGRLLGPGDAAAYPESGPSGRYGPGDMLPQNRNPIPHLAVETAGQFSRVLSGSGAWIPPVASLVSRYRQLLDGLLAVVLLAAVGAAARSDAAVRRAVLFPSAGVVGHWLATLLAPTLYLPQRYLAYTIPLAVVTFLPFVVRRAADAFLTSTGWATRTVAAAVVLITLVPVVAGGAGDPAAGLTVRVDRADPLFVALSRLPPESVIASWPRGVADNVPYLTKRRVLLNEENHQAFHVAYVVEMRRRTMAVMHAVLGSDSRDLVRLRDEFGATHLLIDTRHFEVPPTYFAPFDTAIARVWRLGRQDGFAAQAAVSTATVFSIGSYVLLDLARL